MFKQNLKIFLAMLAILSLVGAFFILSNHLVYALKP